jgi:hypothetical protein
MTGFGASQPQFPVLPGFPPAKKDAIALRRTQSVQPLPASAAQREKGNRKNIPNAA